MSGREKLMLQFVIGFPGTAVTSQTSGASLSTVGDISTGTGSGTTVELTTSASTLEVTATTISESTTTDMSTEGVTSPESQVSTGSSTASPEVTISTTESASASASVELSTVESTISGGSSAATGSTTSEPTSVRETSVSTETTSAQPTISAASSAATDSITVESTLTASATVVEVTTAGISTSSDLPTTEHVTSGQTVTLSSGTVATTSSPGESTSGKNVNHLATILEITLHLLADFLLQYVTLFQSRDIVKNLVSLLTDVALPSPMVNQLGWGTIVRYGLYCAHAR